MATSTWNLSVQYGVTTYQDRGPGGVVAVVRGVKDLETAERLAAENNSEAWPVKVHERLVSEWVER